MTVKDKSQYNKEAYIKKLKEGKETYQERVNFLQEFSLKKSKKSNGAGESGGETSGGGSVILNGDMPTIQQYQGPDAYFDKIIGENYQSGLKGKLEGTDKWNKDIKEQAGKAGVNPLMVKVLMATESGGKHSAKPNPWNCVGLMQVEGDTAKGLGLNWDKVRNDPVYNIYAGCLVMKSKHEYAKGIISRGKDPYAKYKKQGYELKATVHGVSWLYNGFSVPSNGSSKVTTGGYIYANQIAAMYKGFGRDAHKDTVYSTEVLEDNPSAKNSGKDDSSKEKKKDDSKAKGNAFSIQALSVEKTMNDYESPPREPLGEEELKFLQKQSYSYNVPLGKVKGNYFIAPRYIREKYVEDRKLSRTFNLKLKHSPLPPNEYIHMGGPQENYYSEEAADAFKLLKHKLGYKQMVISRGFDPMGESNDSSHTAGIAIDIHVTSPEEAIRIADTAWLMGIRSIAIGPKFVHVDVGPEAVWGYDNLAVYRGPGTVKVGGIERGYR